ncbi:hypothetical protein AcV5_004572 [Taiwanofungus camphoratus]|nr:hypothetical protein AcV5_004572 [Antrodia cinnamomea]
MSLRLHDCDCTVYVAPKNDDWELCLSTIKVKINVCAKLQGSHALVTQADYRNSTKAHVGQTVASRRPIAGAKTEYAC